MVKDPKKKPVKKSNESKPAKFKKETRDNAPIESVEESADENEILEGGVEEDEFAGDTPESHFPTTRADKPEDPHTLLEEDDEDLQENEETFAGKKSKR
jgi:hypothetical protein